MIVRGWAIAAVLAGLLAAAPARAQQPPQGQAPAVQVVPAALEDVMRQADFLGRVQATDRVELRAQVSGILKKRLFTEGQTVKEGDLLFVIDQDPYQAALDQAKADLASAEALAENARVQLDRTRELAAKGNAPTATLDQRVADDAKAQADILKAKAVLRQAEINLSWTEIRAPIGGRIGQAQITPGNLVGPSGSPLAIIVATDPIYVTFPVTQRELLDARRRAAGQPEKLVVRLILADGTNYPEPGTVNLLDVQANTSTDSVTVRAQFPNPRGELVDGATLRAVVEAGEPQKKLVVPTVALAIDQQGPFVLVVGEGDRIVVKRVKLGAQRGGSAVVEEGLAAGDRVVVAGGQRVRPGMVVAASPAEMGPTAP